MTHEMLLETLKLSADPGYGDYQRRIIRDTDYPMLFVRMPALRKIAKAAGKNWKALAKNCCFSSYEEVMAVCLAAAGADDELSERLSVLRPLVHRLDSWGLTDSIVPTLAVKPEEYVELWDFALECIHAEGEYVRRFGIVILLHFFLAEEYLDAVENVVVPIRDGRYYVRMACAWLLAEMAVSDWQRVKAILVSNNLEQAVHNMTVRKIRESYRISKDVKAEAGALRRKENANV